MGFWHLNAPRCSPKKFARAMAIRCAAGAVALLSATFAAAAPAAAQPCEVSGTFAARFEVPVRWRANLALSGSVGLLRYWALVQRTPAENGTFAERVTVCGVAQPNTKTLSLFGGERFGVRYDDATFSASATTEATSTASPSSDGMAVSTPKLALMMGIAFANATETAWPTGEALSASLLPLDGSGQPGAPARSLDTDGLVLPPVDYSGHRRAHTFYVASRVVLQLDSTSSQCDRFAGRATIVPVAGRAGPETTLVGCATTDGGTCSDADLNLANLFQPSMRQERPGHAVWLRVGDEARCEDVRAVLP